MKNIFVILTTITLIGCATPQPVVETAKPWENHYYTVQQFKDGTQNISLENGESIWVISNRTLSRVLKNYMEK